MPPTHKPVTPGAGHSRDQSEIGSAYKGHQREIARRFRAPLILQECKALAEPAERINWIMLLARQCATSAHPSLMGQRCWMPSCLRQRFKSKYREWRRGDSNPRPEMFQDKHPTCVVARLRFRFVARRTTGSPLGYSGASRPRRPGRPAETSPLIDALVRPAGAIRQDGQRYLRRHGILVVAN